MHAPSGHTYRTYVCGSGWERFPGLSSYRHVSDRVIGQGGPGSLGLEELSIIRGLSLIQIWSPLGGPIGAQAPSCFGGVFGQRAHSANYYVVYPGNTPENHPPDRSVHDPFKTASAVQKSGPWDPWLPVVKNSRLFAQRTVHPL